MWEYNADQNRFGTPEALMLLPYWTNNCIDSMEGLYFESSATTPYHFLDQAELSVSPSDPMVGLPYGGLDVAFGVQHLQMLGVRYYIAFSPAVIKQANRDPELTLIAKTKKWPSPGDQWFIYKIASSPMVVPLKTLPNIVANTTSRVGWLNANTTWWLDPKLWGTVAATTGPSNWPTAASVTTMDDAHDVAQGHGDRLEVGLQSISFHVSQIGVPVLVKISYFPRWHATGATGPYRVSPNLMVVIPTSNNVSMVYGSTPLLTVSNYISDLVGVGRRGRALLLHPPPRAGASSTAARPTTCGAERRHGRTTVSWDSCGREVRDGARQFPTGVARRPGRSRRVALRAE